MTSAKWRNAIPVAVAAALVAGCVDAPSSKTASDDYAVHKPHKKVRLDSGEGIGVAAERFASVQPEPLRPFFKALYVEGEHDAVLNFDYLGLAALETGQYEIAAKAFDAAISRIEAIYANNPSAQRAKSLFSEEKVKDFKGEPYERAMTYFYRGLLFARVGDYQNARASFLSAEAQSMMGESESYESTFGLMDYLAGWASHCDGDETKAADLGQRAAKVQPQIFASLTDEVSFVGLVDVGFGPIKYGTGEYKEKLAFKPARRMPGLPDVQASDVTLSSPILAANLNYQAMTRGGRPVDAILNGKAEWKSNTEAASNALTEVGYAATLEGALTNNQNLADAGEIGMAVGLVGGLFSMAMTPAADTRAWTTLPAGVVLVAGQTQGASAPAMSFTPGGDASPIAATLSAQSGKCAIAWGEVPARLQAAAVQVSSPEFAERRHEEANAQLRSFLESTFAGAQSASATEPTDSVARLEVR